MTGGSVILEYCSSCGHQQAANPAGPCRQCGGVRPLEGRYRLEKRLRRGTSREAFRGLSLQDGTSVLLIHTLDSSAGGPDYPDLPHPSLARRVGALVNAAGPWDVYEFPLGVSLSRLMVERRFSELEALLLIEQVLLVVGVIRQAQPSRPLELAPENIFVGQGNIATLYVFGNGPEDGDPTEYLSPEGMRGIHSFEGDLYALGLILLRMLSRLPIPQLVSTAREVRVPSGLRMKRDTGRLLSGLVAVDPQRRFASLVVAQRSVAAAIDAAGNAGQVQVSSGSGRWRMFAFAAVCLFVGAWLLRRPSGTSNRLPQLLLAEPNIGSVWRPSSASRPIPFEIPGVVDWIVAASQGHVLLLRMPALKQVLVFDARQRKATGSLPIRDPEARFAGGNDVAIIAYPTEKVVELWSLQDFRLIKKKKLSLAGNLHQVAMAPGSDGPILLRFCDDSPGLLPANYHFLDGRSLEIAELGALTTHLADSCTDVPTISFVPDGTRFTIRSLGALFEEWSISRSGISLLGTGFAKGDYVLPTPEGLFLTSTVRVLWNGTWLQGGEAETTLPDETGLPFNLWLEGPLHDQVPTLNLYVGTPLDPAPLVRIGEVEGLARHGPRKLPLAMHLHLMMADNLMLVLSGERDQITLFDLEHIDSAMRAQGYPFAYVTTPAPTAATAGQKYEHSLEVFSSSGDSSLELLSAPEGMTLKDGTLRWDVPDGWASAAQVILNVRNGKGASRLYGFLLRGEQARAPPPAHQRP